ncbi:hypothetical protein PPACK8108_LOCUS3160 [Phakopsora pachyrhizi]|uniref:Uncharacterized protein n=1 Tax=Phakopsora pachyrhizi TaxID=170000 RepID=A0AAV0AM73_PHAPC|nr:hypothetical protein PPACK8108_LOCUS3160 [Phakopsora pachyrhizi]
MKSEGEEYEQSGSGNILKVVEREKVDAGYNFGRKVMGQAEMTEREEDEKERRIEGNIIGDSDEAMIAIQGWHPADWGKEWTQLLKVLDNPFNICHSLVTLVESTRYLGNKAPTIHLQILVMTPSLAADMLKKIAAVKSKNAKRPKPFRETIPKKEDNSNSKGAKIVDDKPARFDIDNNDLITVEDNEEDFVRVESKRYESEGSSSEETIGEVSEEEGGEERGNEGLVEGKLEEGNDGMNVFEPIVVTDPFVLTRVVGDWSIYVTPLLMGKDKYELIKQGGWKETMVAQIDDCDGNNGNQGGKTGWMMGWDESGRLEASPLGQVWAGVLREETMVVDIVVKLTTNRLKLTLESYLISVTEKSLKMALNKIIDRTWTLKMQQTIRGDNSSMKPGSETKTSKVMSDGGINIGRIGTKEGLGA